MKKINVVLLCLWLSTLVACTEGMFIRYDVSGSQLSGPGMADSLAAQFTRLCSEHAMKVVSDEKTAAMRTTIVRSSQENVEVVITIQESKYAQIVVKSAEPDGIFVKTLRSQLEALLVSNGLEYRVSQWRSPGFD